MHPYKPKSSSLGLSLIAGITFALINWGALWLLLHRAPPLAPWNGVIVVAGVTIVTRLTLLYLRRWPNPAQLIYGAILCLLTWWLSPWLFGAPLVQLTGWWLLPSLLVLYLTMLNALTFMLNSYTRWEQKFHGRSWVAGTILSILGLVTTAILVQEPLFFLEGTGWPLALYWLVLSFMVLVGYYLTNPEPTK